MLVKVIGLDEKKVEIEAELDESFSALAQRAGDALHYHGSFGLREEDGKTYPPAMNLGEGDAEGRDWDKPLYIYQL